MTRRTWRARTAGGLAALAVLYLVAAFLVPRALRWQGETQASRVLGRDVRIGRVEFVPWKLDLAFEDVQVAAAPPGRCPATRPCTSATDSSPLLTIGRLHANLAWASIWKLAPIVQSLDVDALHLRFSRLAPGSYDVDDLIDRVRRKPSDPSSAPSYFSIHNLRMRDAAIVLEDRPSGRVHALTALRMDLPLLSNLPAQVDTLVEPRLSFLLNGVPFDSGGRATPFAKTRSGQFRLKIDGLDIGPYLAYLPDSLPFRIQAGALTADLTVDLALPPGAPPLLDLHGSVTATNTRLADHEGHPVLAWRRLGLEVRSVAPLRRQVAVSSLQVEGAQLSAERDVAGTINLLRLVGVDAGRPAVPGSSASAATSAPGTTSQAPTAWRVELDRLAFVDSAVTWTDARTLPPASLRIDGLSADAQRIAWPIVKPIEITLQGALRPDTRSPVSPVSPVSPAAFSIAGSATDRAARLKLSVTSLPLEAFHGYFAQLLAPKVGGVLSAHARLDWTADRAPGAGLSLAIDDGTIEALTLQPPADRSDGGSAPASAAVSRLALADARVDTATRRVTVARLAIEQPAVSIARSKDGRFDIERWAVAAPTPPTVMPVSPAADPWQFLLQNAVVTGGRFQFADAVPAGATSADPLRVAVDDLRIAAYDLAWQGSRPTVPAQIEVSGRVGPPRAPGDDTARADGSFDWRGVVGVAPALAIGSLRVERIPVHTFMPYAGRKFGLRVAHAEFGYVGSLSVKERPDGLDIDAGANLLLGAVRLEGAAPQSPGETLLSWNTLGLDGVRVSVKPGAKPRIDIAQAALDDFYARLVVTADGRLNFSRAGLLATEDAAAHAAPPRKAIADPGPSDLPVDIRLDGTALTRGRIDFSDRFIRPNYSAALTELTGRMGAVRSDRPAGAALSLRGKAAGTALLDISATVNPLSRPVALDVHAKATDLELAPLSPYAGKYAGYAVERGKMSVDVSYRLDPDGRLEAKNKVVLNQLTFGARIDSPAATKLPVLLAVALLKDRDGVIDLDLPISGSLDDPQFSVAGIIGRLLGNLLVKALTSPFALLTGGATADRGGSDPAQVEFVPGTSRLAAAGRAAVDDVARALIGKPHLTLTVTGSANARTEQEAYRSAALEERIESARKKQTVASAAAASAAATPLGVEPRNRLIKDLYADSDLPDKPRNVLGFAEDVPVPEMEARLKAAIPVDDDSMRALALQRSVAVRGALIQQGLPSERLFLAAPQLRSGEPGDAPSALPRAQLSLSVN